MDLYYTVEPSKRWQDMTRYKSFVLNRIKYYIGDFVYVANESTVKHQKATTDEKGGCEESDGEWIARVLEIRASDEHHVYTRVYWMYWPDEVPSGTIYLKMTVQGRQPYYGTNELIASNHMDIINVTSVTAHSIRIICKCGTPTNPNKTLIECPSADCAQWMHHECLTHDVLMRVYKRLGTDKPHRTEGAVLNEEKADEAVHPLSPTDAEERGVQPTIDVRSRGTQGNVYVKEVREEAPETESSTPKLTPSKPITVTLSKGSVNDGCKKTSDHKPYEGLYKARFETQEGLAAWEIHDLRKNVTDGEKSWTEKAYCLICGTDIE
ncbi:hypothetical protein ACHAPK_011049 [Fusarium culmorum]